MSTAANLLVILIFLAGFYTLLGLLCGIVEKAGELAARPRKSRRVRRAPRRGTRGRGITTTPRSRARTKILGIAPKEITGSRESAPSTATAI
jgi:hypothetical protein